jgi:hypothetical protein
LNWDSIDQIVDFHEVRSVGPRIITAARIVASLHPSALPPTVMAAIGHLKGAETYGPILGQEVAVRLRDNIDWLQRFREFMGNRKQMAVAVQGLPSWWDSSIQTWSLLQHIKQWGFWNIPKFLLETNCFKSRFD